MMIVGIIVVCICIVLGVFFIRGSSDAQFRDIIIRGTTIRVEVMDTAAKQAQGLSGREPLRENEGMLFLFDTPGVYPFWMKDMKFQIDIIWILGNTIVGFEENAELPSGFSIPRYSPPSVVDSVLEMNAGSVKRLGIQIGDVIQ